MPHDVTVLNSKFIVKPEASFTVKPGAKLLFQRAVGYPSEKPLQMSWPEGSFSNELTEVNKNYYTVSFEDGTSLSFFYDEDSKYGEIVDAGEMGDHLQFHKTEDGGLEIKTYIYESITKDSLSSLTSRTEGDKTYYTVPLKYDQSIEIYEDPDNAGQYKTDNGDYSVSSWNNWVNINVSSNGEITLKTLTLEEVSSLSKKELLYAHDDVFSYTYDAVNDCWVRRAQFMIFQPGSIDHSSITDDNSTWRIFELTTPVTSMASGKTSYSLCITRE